MTFLKRILRTAVSVLLLCLLLCGCSVYDILGVDTNDYEHEEVTEALAIDGDVAEMLKAMIPIMVQNSPYLSEFDSPTKAAELYRNGILCFLLAGNYAKYNANNDLIDKAQALYPTLEITTVIPAIDFASTVYKYFGGTSSVKNASTPLFTYLDRVNSYVSTGIGVDSSAEPVITELYETENTYVCRFYNEMRGEKSDTYRLLLMKRNDGTFYMRSLSRVSDK